MLGDPAIRRPGHNCLFEHGMPPAHQRWIGTTWEPDPLILDDRALAVNVHGKGLVIVTGCGHAGVWSGLAWTSWPAGGPHPERGSPVSESAPAEEGAGAIVGGRKTGRTST